MTTTLPSHPLTLADIERLLRERKELRRILLEVLDWMPCGFTVRHDERVMIDKIKAVLAPASKEEIE